ncbi:cyclic AMP-dependent transcription factor ATF-1-like [Clinocottus analis]|uniref:cyclic AMP-dependent transcription factor ATF-1-like n=1 Tax=Clinocottus analis TaxID=304258 RepID=UPI0035C1D9CE
MDQVQVEKDSAPDAPFYMENGQIGFVIRAPFQFLPVQTENPPPMYLPSTPLLQPQCSGESMNMVLTNNISPLPANSANLTASSSLPQKVVEARAHESVESVDAGLKRVHRLIRNRDASRECRRKRKEYVKCLEDRLDMLENRNKTLIEELKAIKDINWHKVQVKQKEYADGLERHNILLETENRMLKDEFQRLMTM